MKKVLVTGSGGLIGSEACLFYIRKGDTVLGIDNNTRKSIFGPNGSVTRTIGYLSKFAKYKHRGINVTNRDAVSVVIRDFSPDVIIHCAAQPSHDKAASIPYVDFDINAVGTFNLLEEFRRLGKKKSVFIQVSTNKVYGDRPNSEPLVESEKRYDFHPDSPFFNGVDERMNIDQCTHSLMGASKLAGDIAAQEYGRYFDLNVGVFRGGCLTGPQHAGVELHGFLSYIVKCAIVGDPYTIFGYKGKQVRDQIHSWDVISAFDRFVNDPRPGEVYNLGGGRENSASVLEIIDTIKEKTGKSLTFNLRDEPRIGDHICYYTDMSKFKSHFPGWEKKYSLSDIVDEVIEKQKENVN